MYLSSLNYDFLFKKVFMHTSIAKQFFEDLFDITIEEIKPVRIVYKLTDKAMRVKFDYRCKVDGEYIIFEMQQRYPKDSIKRFYTYTCVGNVVQLEDILEQKKAEEVLLAKKAGKPRRVRDEYKYILPVKTIVWMADDNLGFEEDYMCFTMLPQNYLNFITDNELWSNGNLEELQKKRNFLLKLAENETKGLSFLRKNQLIFLFQKNIVRNKKNKKYVSWFEFAQKSANKKNQETDFESFENNKIFKKMIELLKIENLNDYEIDLAEELEKEKEALRDEMEEELAALAAEYEKKFEKKYEKKFEKEYEKRFEKAMIQEKKIAITKMLKANLPFDAIAEFSNLSMKELQRYIREIQAN